MEPATHLAMCIEKLHKKSVILKDSILELNRAALIYISTSLDQLVGKM